MRDSTLARIIWLVMKRKGLSHDLRKWLLPALVKAARSLPKIENNVCFYSKVLKPEEIGNARKTLGIRREFLPRMMDKLHQDFKVAGWNTWRCHLLNVNREFDMAIYLSIWSPKDIAVQHCIKVLTKILCNFTMNE